MSSQTSTTALGTERISKLLFKYAIPAIIAMTAASLYNMVDSIFIGQGVGALAISGLALTMPLMGLTAAFGSLVGIGASTLTSIKLGQNDTKSATVILGNVILLNLIIGIVFSIVMMLFLGPILIFFGASPSTFDYAYDYMIILLSGTVATHLYLGMNDMLRASGYPGRAMAIMLTAVVTNCLLDWLFIFGFGWGIAGAAWATVIAQCLAMVLEFIHFTNKKHFLHFRKGIFHLKAHIIKGIFAIGLSPFLMNVCASVIVILINNALKNHGGDLFIGAYGIVNRVAFLFIMIVIGLNQGMQPIVGYNYGARKMERVIGVLKIGIITAMCVTTTGFLICQTIPQVIAALFTNDPTLLEVSEQGLRLVLLMFPLVGFQIVSSNFFQSIGHARKAIFLSLTRQLIFLVPLLLILPHYFGSTGVWISMPIADMAATALSATLLFRQLKKLRLNTDNFVI